MTIRADSRYANHETSLITGRDGITRETLMPRRPPSISATVADYTWRENDRLDVLAAKQFGDDTMGWVIAQVNPEVMDWLAVSPGTLIRLPRGTA
ncbi:hypothetical protein [Streptomyces sp. NPDC017448]|uniref:hypothetical protein n=1 Tax=Streptomyces sp. NPDC017448 TaxID=3364996 RepID=UPI0037B27935